ncbi:hypothetical protein FRC20_009809 [Serendipita sp. 405]|nr:hypothetical protein FRC20_009809 [Serendipita sp. 405]
MMNMVHGIQGMHSTLREVLVAFRQGGPFGSPMHHVASPEVIRQAVHSPVDTRGRPIGYPQPVSSATPPSASSYENQFSPAAANHPHGPYASSNTQQPPVPPHQPSASSQPSHPPYHPGFPSLPPISPATTNVMPPPKFPTSLPPLRAHISEYQSNIRNSQPSPNPFSMQRPGSGRAHNNSSNVTSADSSEDEGTGELPGAGLVAPLEVLRDLGEQHELRATNQENHVRRPRSPSLEPDGTRPKKRRKTSPLGTQKTKHDFPDIVTKGIVTLEEARALFHIFYQGCSTFLPVFDSNFDTFESLHERSPFAVNAICLVASQVRDGGGPTSELTLRCREEVHPIVAQTLFAPFISADVVRAVVILSGWSPNGWLTCGHAVRMALQLNMNKAWPRLLRRIKNNKVSTMAEERELVVAARTWFCLYLFEHQMSYGTGRPAILKEDDSVLGGSALLSHPLTIEDDARLVSTVELMVFRERAQDSMPLDRPFTDERAMKLAEATENFHKWFATWDTIFSRQYPDTTFYRQSLQIQYLFAELYHEAIALRGVAGLDDASKIPESQRVVVERAIQSARQGLEICLRSPSYREGLKYAVTYTHLTAVFAASFLMRLARLFPQECEKLGGIESIFVTVEELADLLSTIPATRYARTLRLMLSNRKRRLLPQKVQNSDSATHSGSDAASQQTLVSPQQQQAIPYIEGQMMYRPMHAHHRMMSGDSIYSSASSQVYVSQGTPRQYTMVPNRGHGVYPRPLDVVTPTEYQMFDPRPDQATPIWMTEDNLGDAGYGLETFILPQPFDSVIL